VEVLTSSGEGEFRPESATATGSTARGRGVRAQGRVHGARQRSARREVLPRTLAAPAGNAAMTREADAGGEWLG
jgi:hypothetical protein